MTYIYEDLSTDSASLKDYAGDILNKINFTWSTLLIIAGILLVISLIIFIARWKIYKRGGQPGWAALIPIYNTYAHIRVAKLPVWTLLLAFTPFIAILKIILWYETARAFGKSRGFGIGMNILGFIFIPILGFGKDEYISEDNMQNNINVAPAITNINTNENLDNTFVKNLQPNVVIEDELKNSYDQIDDNKLNTTEEISIPTNSIDTNINENLFTPISDVPAEEFKPVDNNSLEEITSNNDINMMNSNAVTNDQISTLETVEPISSPSNDSIDSLLNTISTSNQDLDASNINNNMGHNEELSSNIDSLETVSPVNDNNISEETPIASDISIDSLLNTISTSNQDLDASNTNSNNIGLNKDLSIDSIEETPTISDPSIENLSDTNNYNSLEIEQPININSTKQDSDELNTPNNSEITLNENIIPNEDLFAPTPITPTETVDLTNNISSDTANNTIDTLFVPEKISTIDSRKITDELSVEETNNSTDIPVTISDTISVTPEVINFGNTDDSAISPIDIADIKEKAMDINVNTSENKVNFDELLLPIDNDDKNITSSDIPSFEPTTTINDDTSNINQTENNTINNPTDFSLPTINDINTDDIPQFNNIVPDETKDKFSMDDLLAPGNKEENIHDTTEPTASTEKPITTTEDGFKICNNCGTKNIVDAPLCFLCGKSFE